MRGIITKKTLILTVFLLCVLFFSACKEDLMGEGARSALECDNIDFSTDDRMTFIPDPASSLKSGEEPAEIKGEIRLSKSALYEFEVVYYKGLVYTGNTRDYAKSWKKRCWREIRFEGQYWPGSRIWFNSTAEDVSKEIQYKVKQLRGAYNIELNETNVVLRICKWSNKWDCRNLGVSISFPELETPSLTNLPPEPSEAEIKGVKGEGQNETTIQQQNIEVKESGVGECSGLKKISHPYIVGISSGYGILWEGYSPACGIRFSKLDSNLKKKGGDIIILNKTISAQDYFLIKKNTGYAIFIKNRLDAEKKVRMLNMPYNYDVVELNNKGEVIFSKKEFIPPHTYNNSIISIVWNPNKNEYGVLESRFKTIDIGKVKNQTFYFYRLDSNGNKIGKEIVVGSSPEGDIRVYRKWALKFDSNINKYTILMEEVKKVYWSYNGRDLYGYVPNMHLVKIDSNGNKISDNSFELCSDLPHGCPTIQNGVRITDIYWNSKRKGYDFFWIKERVPILTKLDKDGKRIGEDIVIVPVAFCYDRENDKMVTDCIGNEESTYYHVSIAGASIVQGEDGYQLIWFGKHINEEHPLISQDENEVLYFNNLDLEGNSKNMVELDLGVKPITEYDMIWSGNEYFFIGEQASKYFFIGEQSAKYLFGEQASTALEDTFILVTLDSQGNIKEGPLDFKLDIY